jgi:hypothetical protein
MNFNGGLFILGIAEICVGVYMILSRRKLELDARRIRSRVSNSRVVPVLPPIGYALIGFGFLAVGGYHIVSSFQS